MTINADPLLSVGEKTTYTNKYRWMYVQLLKDVNSNVVINSIKPFTEIVIAKSNCLFWVVSVSIEKVHEKLSLQDVVIMNCSLIR